jgi:hypothetical protein
MRTFSRILKLIVYAHAVVPVTHYVADAQVLVASSHSSYASGLSVANKQSYEPLGDALNKLKSEHGIYFLYRGTKLKTTLVPTDLKKSGSSESTIKNLISSADLTYRKIGNIYIIAEAEPKRETVTLTLAEASVTASVDKKISGKVSDEKGEALPGVNIILKGTTVGTTTSTDGTYTLTVGDNDQTLVFSFLGYTEQEVKIGNRSAIDISLIPDIKQLSEVIVVGYGTMDKKEVTSAITHISERNYLPLALTIHLCHFREKYRALRFPTWEPQIPTQIQRSNYVGFLPEVQDWVLLSS